MVVSAGEAQTAVIHSVTVRVHRDVDEKAVMTAYWALVKAEEAQTKKERIPRRNTF